MVDIDDEDSFRTELELCILAKLVAEARLMPGLMLCTKLGLVNDPFWPSTSPRSGRVTSAVLSEDTPPEAMSLFPGPPLASRSTGDVGNSTIPGVVSLRCIILRPGVEYFRPPEAAEDKDLP